MADPFLTLNGQAGERLTRAGDNLLDANTAHAIQAQWPNALGGDVSDTNGHFPDGFGWTRATLDSDTGASSLRRVGLASPVHGGGVFTFSCDLETESVTPTDYSILVASSGDANLRTPIQTLATGKHRLGGQVTLNPGEINGIWIEARTGGTIGDFYEASRWMMKEGAVPTVFVPSINIVGDLDQRAELAPVLWSDTNWQAVLNRPGAVMWLDRQLAPGQAGLRLTYTDQFNDRSWVTPTVPKANGERGTIRSTFDVSTGEWEAFIDGNSIGTITLAAGPGVPAGGVIQIGDDGGAGQRMAADVYFVELRDGIDGPVVYRMDAADVLAAI